MGIQYLLAGRVGLGITVAVAVVSFTIAVVFCQTVRELKRERNLFERWQYEMSTDEMRHGWRRDEYGPSGVP